MFKNNKVWLRVINRASIFFQTFINEKLKLVSVGTRWFTNLDHQKRNEKMNLWKRYDPNFYLKYDNYDGVMGVPITFLDKYNPEQFEIIQFRKGYDSKDLTINGKVPFFRIIIKNKIIV